ncbi:ribbon-helix-helix domain-containing protein [Methanoregula sp.]
MEHELVSMTVKLPKGLLAKIDKTWRLKLEFHDRSDYVRHVLRGAIEGTV